VCRKAAPGVNAGSITTAWKAPKTGQNKRWRIDIVEAAASHVGHMMTSAGYGIASGSAIKKLQKESY
jgi:hypothetical protein